MNFYIFLGATALAVSLDSGFAGFAMGMKTERYWAGFPLAVAVITLLLCVIAVKAGEILDGLLGDFVTFAGVAVLALVGIINFFKSEKCEISHRPTLKESLLIGAAVGTDAAAANFSLCLMGHTSFLIPLLFAVTHFITVSAGFFLANRSFLKNLKHTNKFAGLLLVSLALFKLFG